MKIGKFFVIVLPLLLASCGTKDVVLTKKYKGSSYEVNQTDPRYVRCTIYTGDNYTGKIDWTGIIDRWIYDNELSYYKFYWCEYSDSSHAIYIGAPANHWL